jgi:NADPH-dependent glutamate synthase beta subunit-like oxidoreductase
MDQNRLRQLEEQCIQDCPPPCTSLCPVHVDIRQMSLAASGGDFTAALAVFRKSAPFPGIVARTCDQPCQLKCYRGESGGVIQVAAIEKACLEYGGEQPPKAAHLPKKNASVAVIGGGLSGLTAAYELARKGFRVELFERQERLGGRLWDFPEDVLPRNLIEEETGLPAAAGVIVHLGQEAGPELAASEAYDAVFMGTGKAGTGGFALTPDPISFQTADPKVFAGGSLRDLPLSTIRSISDGRRAAVSIDRFLQKVSLTAARANEGAYETRLVVNTVGIAVVQAPPRSGTSSGFSPEEAAAEAARCLQCECMECVKVCEYLRHYGKYPGKYVREVYNNLSMIMRVRSGNQFINSCTLCGLCGEVCPTDLDMGRVNLEARRTMVKKGKMPVSAHDFALRDMAFSNSAKFTAILTPQEGCSALFFPGCQLAASNPEYIPQVYQTLSSVLPNLGVMLRCCGAPADWAGEEALFQDAIEDFKREWQALDRPALVLACSSCYGIFKQYLPGAELHTIWEVYEKHHLFPLGRVFDNEYVVHDPCTSRHEGGWQETARAALGAMGAQFHELDLSGDITACCGYGGVAWLANPELTRDIIRRRIGEDAADYLTYCVMCRDLFAAEGKPTLHLLDLVYGGDLDALARRKGPDYSRRHENRMICRRQMVKTFTGKDGFEMESFENYQLALSPEVRAVMETRLILAEDVQRVIEHAETSGESFLNRDSGHSLAFFKPNFITYWVEYSREGDQYRVHDAYSHRMEFDGEAGK